MVIVWLQTVRKYICGYILHPFESFHPERSQACSSRHSNRFVFNTRLLEEEVAKRSELERLHSDQQRALSQTEAEKQELVAERERKERELSTAMEQLDKLEKEQQGALQQFQVRGIS